MTRTTTPSRIVAALLTACGLLALPSCDDKQGTGATHQITGKLASSSGKPLSNVKVAVFGYPHGSHESFSKVLDVPGPADKYSVDVPEGTYDAPRASISVNYNGKSFMLPLAAADNTRDWGDQKESKSGLTRDFVWRISGQRPTGLGESKESAGFWGAAVNLDKGADIGDFGTIDVTLTPDGPLVDGSQGKVVTYKRAVPWQKHEDHLLTDIPIGRYVATAKFTGGGAADNKPKPLRLVVTSGNPKNLDELSPQTTAASVVIEFEQMDLKAGAGPGQEPKFYVPTLLVFPEKEKKGGF
jgi:hypothetical protein